MKNGEMFKPAGRIDTFECTGEGAGFVYGRRVDVLYNPTTTGRSHQFKAADVEPLTAEEARTAKLYAVAEGARAAFWSHVARSYPEAKTGDVDPFEMDKFDAGTAAGLESWIEANVRPAQ